MKGFWSVPLTKMNAGQAALLGVIVLGFIWIAPRILAPITEPTK